MSANEEYTSYVDAMYRNALAYETACIVAPEGHVVPLPDGLNEDVASIIRHRIAKERAASTLRPLSDAPVRVQILNEGATITNGDRDAEYGHPSINLGCAGELKLLARKHVVRDISPAEWEALDLAITKLSRILTGPKPKRDTYVDAATYIAIAGEIALKP